MEAQATADTHMLAHLLRLLALVSMILLCPFLHTLRWLLTGCVGVYITED